VSLHSLLHLAARKAEKCLPVDVGNLLLDIFHLDNSKGNEP
jgi:hypothetical protein